MNPVADLASAGVDLLLVPSASPFTVGKHARHAAELARLASRHELTVAVVNQRGANDDLIFNGEAFVVDAQGRTRFVRGEFEPRANQQTFLQAGGWAKLPSPISGGRGPNLKKVPTDLSLADARTPRETQKEDVYNGWPIIFKVD